MPNPARQPQLAHMVYFTLKDNSPAAIERLLAGCAKYLTAHPGTVYAGAGTLCHELAREVNVRDWDVAWHIVFETKADHDRYQTAPRHIQFVHENKENWKQVRVFDALVS
jgi:hypothetical protein